MEYCKSDIDLGSHACCFSVSPWRVAFQRRIFAERGLSFPEVAAPIKVAAPTRQGEPSAYSGLAINFMARLLEAHAKGWPYCVIYEDDAYPCPDPQGRLNALLKKHPLPADCGILCLGDINGVSRFRGRQTLLLDRCSAPYTRLVPGTAENKGSHALLVFAGAYIPFVQAIAQCGVTDVAISRISKYSSLHAYGLFFDPLFVQHNYSGGKDPSSPYRLPELVATRGEAAANFPRPTRQTALLLAPAPRFIVLSNAPEKVWSGIDIRKDDVLVFLNKAVDFARLAGKRNRRLLISRRHNGDKASWFLPPGQEYELTRLYDDFLLLSDDALEAERPWYAEYLRESGGKVPTTGWVAYRLLKDCYPGSDVVLCGFNPGGENGSYKWPRHGWAYEADYYKRNGVNLG